MHFNHHSRKSILFIVSILMAYFISVYIMYGNIKKQEQALSDSHLLRNSMIIAKKVSDYIGPVRDLATYVTDILNLYKTNWKDLQPENNPLLLLLRDYKQFSSVFIVFADGEGFGVGRLQKDTVAFISVKKTGNHNTATIHKITENRDYSFHIVSENTQVAGIDLLKRPWVEASVIPRKIYCTSLYKFYYSNEYGITISVKFLLRQDQTKNPKSFTIGFDILAHDVAKFINNIKEDVSGDIFILDHAFNIIPLPAGPEKPAGSHEHNESTAAVKPAVYDSAIAHYLRMTDPNRPFTFTALGRKWRVYIKKIDFPEYNSMYVGVMEPNYPPPILAKTKFILFISILLISFLIFYLAFTLREKQLQNKLLIEKNLAIANSKNYIQKIKKEPIDVKYGDSESDPFLLNSRTTLRILDELENLINEKFYLSQDATLYNVSKTLGTNTTYLSKIINSYKGKSYSDFLNELRINEAIRRIIKGDILKKYSLEGFSYDLGFKSKSSFNNAFKKYTGVTPSAFIASMENKNKSS